MVLAIVAGAQGGFIWGDFRHWHGAWRPSIYSLSEKRLREDITN